MKFTEEQAVEALRAELTNKGRKTLHMSERTLASMTTTLVRSLATEETGLPDFVTSAIEILNIAEGDARKKNSDFAKYKEAHPDSDPTPSDAKQPQVEQPKVDPIVAALQAEVEALKQKNAEAEKLSKLSAKKNDLTNILNSKGIKDKEWLDTFLSEVNITEDMDVEAKAESYAKLYNRSHANSPLAPTPGNPNNGKSSEVPDAIKQAKEIAKHNREIQK